MLPEGMDIEQEGQVVTCHFRVPEVTHLEMQEVIEECMGHMRNDGALHFVFDMENVEFLASSCIGALVSFLQDVEHTRGRIALANCRENVLFLFKVTRLDSVFAIYDDVKEAVESF